VRCEDAVRQVRDARRGGRVAIGSVAVFLEGLVWFGSHGASRAGGNGHDRAELALIAIRLCDATLRVEFDAADMLLDNPDMLIAEYINK
jgi:hypothetical protein